MSHLGQRISALIDGELSDSERDRVLTHIAGCDACRQEAVALRALKQRMHSLGEAMVDAALTGRLMAMAMPPDGRPWTARQPWRSRGAFPAARMLTAGILASTVAGLGAAAFFVGGEQQLPSPKVTPAVDTFLVQHAIVTGDLPVTPASGTAGSSASAAPVAGARSVPASPSSSRVTGTAAAGAPIRAEHQPAAPASGNVQSGIRRPASAVSGSNPSDAGLAAGMMRRGLQLATAAASASASPGP